MSLDGTVATTSDDAFSGCSKSLCAEGEILLRKRSSRSNSFDDDSESLPFPRMLLEIISKASLLHYQRLESDLDKSIVEYGAVAAAE